MSEINSIFADNLIFLRKRAKLTQLELAETLNYSDKAVSKWERGEAVPDVSVLLSIAELFGVTVDDLIKEHKDGETIGVSEEKRANVGLTVTLITFLGIITVQTVVLIALSGLADTFDLVQFCFIFPLPVYAICATVFMALWGRKSYLIIPISALAATFTISTFFLVHFLNGEYIFAILALFVPVELIIVLSFNLSGNSIKVKK